MCSHRAPAASMVPSKREMEGSPVPRPLKAADWSIAPATPTTASAPSPSLSAASTSPGSGSPASLGALGQDVLDSVAAFLHPLDLARVGLCARGLLADTEQSAALLLKRLPAPAPAPAYTTTSSTATPGARGARYRYLSAFEVAAAGGEKLKAALRTIYEGRPRRTGAAAAPMTKAATTAVRMAPAPGGGAAAAAVRGFAAVGPSLGGRLVRVPSSSEINLSGAQVGDEGVEHLALALRVSKAHRVRLLNLSRCDISDQGARALLHALKDHAEVDTLCLGQNRIGSPGAHCIAEFLASSPPRLRSLSISDNPISDEGANDIVGALPACASLVTLSMRCQGVSSQVREEVRMTWGGRGGNSVFGLYI